MTAEGGLVAGRYRLGQRLGSGAMGIVWQAHDERLHRTVAIKQMLLQPGLTDAQAEESRRRSMREGRIAARLAHPNAITVYDVAEHDGDPWLIMEYLPSKSLATVLSERGTLPPAEAAAIGAQVASALVAAHAAGIVHRDIKPANVLLAEDGTVKITDFGISRATGDVTVTATGMLAGTPAYLAPEVAKGENPTPAADVFSLGSTLYTAVEGHSPFGLSENTLALLYAVAAGKITPPRQAGPLTALLMQLLRVDPNERPSLTTARDALAAVAEGRPAPTLATNIAGAGAATTDRIAGNRLPPPGMRAGPPTPPRASQPPWPPKKDSTRLDVNPFAEPAPSGPGPVMYREPVPSGPNSRPRPPAPANRARSVALTVLAIVAAALVGILVASLLTSGDDGQRSQQPPADPTLPAERTSESTEDTPTDATEDTPTDTTEETTDEQPTEETPTNEDYVQAVEDYYDLLPDDTDAAWKLLTERARNKSTGGKKGYERFWSTIDEVEVRDAYAAGNRVAATLRYKREDGDKSTESYSFALVERDGELMIDNFVRTGGGGGGGGDDDRGNGNEGNEGRGNRGNGGDDDGEGGDG
ncbi:serine/threonine-protein kinase [Actinophytocola gossypii]|uniref:non-specific serine/threonine protein kinase n=1 Tax=Actinophytocola gossypii TaxID=2812003 RepID=A0ABT2JJR6_9PSEU|nr:serine/threonine-protein kinase [Actinophytocola gossypii]MCT2588137.1 protein kinase [Actinophytocola gossypii]